MSGHLEPAGESVSCHGTDLVHVDVDLDLAENRDGVDSLRNELASVSRK